MHRPVRVSIAAALLVFVLSGVAQSGARAAAEDLLAVQPVQASPEGHFEQFLDRLMRAESNGRDTAANPRSTALGAFQFIESTFLSVTRRYFAREVAELSDASLLALRTNRSFARQVAAAYSRENAAYLSEQGLHPTFGHLRLAFLLGAVGAAKVLKAEPQTPIADVLHAAVLRANPFMRGMTAASLNQRAHRDLDLRPDSSVAMPKVAAGSTVTAVEATCNQGLPSCRRWIALRARQLDAAKPATAAKPSRGTTVRKTPAKTS
ncbi:MAG TPA: hypothetical protein VFR73_18645 [Hyphomicrobiaceae bacterium]|nr:hypothetical protein [Hyphomicrobiaceae bacterium]